MKTNIIQNPIRPGFFPDPSIVKVDNDYYMVNSSFLYFPCVPISHSKDLVNWEIIGHAVTDPSYVDLSTYDPGRGFWAPDISYYNGIFYIAVTLRGNDTWEHTHRQMIVWSDCPEGPYSKPVFIDTKGIDPSLFHDTDGRHYMLHNLGVQILELNKDCLSKKTESRMLCEGWSKIKTEGSHLIKKDAYYYLFMAEGGTGDGHMISVARSKSLDSEFEMCPHNPLITQRDPSATLQRTGHGKPFIGPDGEWYIVFLCSRKRGGRYSLLGRETAIAKLKWDENGWPVINDGKGPLDEITVDYNYEVIPEKPFILDLNEKNFPLDVIYYKNNTLIRQTKIDCEVSLKADFNKAKSDCGLIFYYDVNSYIKFGFINKKIKVTTMNGTVSDKEMLNIEATLNEISDCSLIIKTKGLKKEFYLGKKLICTLDDCSLLTDEGLLMGKRFTGPTVGVFNLEENKEALREFIFK